MFIGKSLRKGIIRSLFIILFSSVVSILIFVPVSWPDGQMGSADVNGDGKITLEDVESVLIVIREGSGPDKVDVNRDGRVDLKDLDIVTQAYEESEARKTNSK